MRLDNREAWNWLKNRWLLWTTIVLAIALVFILFVPIIPNSTSGTMTVCGQGGCVSGIVQYDSISYAYGGWGAWFQTGVNYYTVEGWLCSCPAELPGQYIPCCVPPYAGIIWPVVYLLLGGMVVSTAVLIWKPSYQNHPPNI